LFLNSFFFLFIYFFFFLAPGLFFHFRCAGDAETRLAQLARETRFILPFCRDIFRGDLRVARSMRV